MSSPTKVYAYDHRCFDVTNIILEAYFSRWFCE